MTTEPTKGAVGWEYCGVPVEILNDPDCHGRTPITFRTEDGKVINSLVGTLNLTSPKTDLAQVIREILIQWERPAYYSQHMSEGSVAHYIATRLRERFPELAEVTQPVCCEPTSNDMTEVQEKD